MKRSNIAKTLCLIACLTAITSVNAAAFKGNWSATLTRSDGLEVTHTPARICLRHIYGPFYACDRAIKINGLNLSTNMTKEEFTSAVQE